MDLVVPPSRDWARKFNFGAGPSESGPRFGGTAPDGLAVALRPGSEYLMTFALSNEPVLFASVFRNGTAQEFWSSMNAGFQFDDRILVVAHHQDLRRSAGTEHQSVVTPHPIVPAQAISLDKVATDTGGVVPASGHKFGGAPYCIQEPELPGAAELFEAGYLQVIQVDFPGAEDRGIRGNWPFLDGLFQLFWKPPFFGVPYHWNFQK